MASSTTQKRRNRQIAAEARLKFRPAEAKLAEQLRTAAAELERGEATARSVAETVRQAARQAIPQITKATSDQQGLAERLRGVAPALPADSPFAKAASVEQTGADTRLGEMRTQAITDYVGQQARASAGEAYQVQNVRNQYAAAKERIRAAQGDVAAQKGDYMAQRLGEFAETDSSRSFQRAQQQRGFEHSDASREDSQAESRRRDAAKKKGKKGPEAGIQKKFTQAVAGLATATYQKEIDDPDKPGQKKMVKVPMTRDYVRTHRQDTETRSEDGASGVRPLAGDGAPRGAGIPEGRQGRSGVVQVVPAREDGGRVDRAGRRRVAREAVRVAADGTSSR